MNRYFVLFFLMAAGLSCIFPSPAFPADDAQQNIQIDTPGQAAEFAAKLANERAQRAFGKTPFTPESYSPRLIGSKWHWGKIEPPGIRGYSAEVEFNTDGSDPKVRAVLHTDGMSIIDLNQDRFPIQMEVIEEAPPPSPEDTGNSDQ